MLYVFIPIHTFSDVNWYEDKIWCTINHTVTIQNSPQLLVSRHQRDSTPLVLPKMCVWCTGFQSEPKIWPEQPPVGELGASKPFSFSWGSSSEVQLSEPNDFLWLSPFVAFHVILEGIGLMQIPAMNPPSEGMRGGGTLSFRCNFIDKSSAIAACTSDHCA